MTQQPPPPPTDTTGTISPDGRYIWNGAEWVANVPAGSPPPPVKKRGKARTLGIGCLGLIVLIVIIAALSSGGKNASGTAESSQAASAACSPEPCANADGFTVSVTKINRNLPAGDFSKPEAGNHFVAMQVTLHNGSSDKKNANPFNFSLRDSQGQEHDIAFSPNEQCGIWQAVDLTAGATLGPKPLCFEAAGDPDKPLTLIWSPEFFASKVEIPLQ